MVQATRGITAGSGFVTTELRILMQDVVLITLAEWAGTVDLTLYVDDLTIETQGGVEEAAQRNAAVVDSICSILQQQMDFDVSQKKSVVVASQPIAALLAAEQSVTKKITAVRSAKLLGTSTKAGARRAVGAMRVRITQFKKRVPKFQILRRIGVNTAAMTQAAAAATMLYGAECCGVSSSMMEECRRVAAKVCVGTAVGKSTTRSLYAVDGSAGTVDPAFLAHLSPITAWAAAWWDEWAEPEVLKTAFQNAKPRKQSGLKQKGPSAQSLHRLKG